MTENIEPQFGAATRSPLSNSAVPVTLKKNLLGFGAPCFNFSSSLTPCEAQTCSGCKSVLLYSAPYIRLGYLGYLGPIDASPAHVDCLSQTGLEKCMSGPIFFQFRPSTTSDSFMSMVHGCMVPANRQELVHVDVHDF